MCYHGTLTYVNLYKPNENSKKKRVPVDSCISEEIQFLNNNQINTLGCCCGHGQAGTIIEYENGFGKWKVYGNVPQVLIHEDSVELAKKIGYRPFLYYYADGSTDQTWQMFLKTGCMTIEECEDWKNK